MGEIKKILLALMVFSGAHALAAEGQQFHIGSSEFSNQGSIPSRFTCEGENISPALNWSNVPAGAKSLALIVDDPDAPDPKAPKMTWVHWVTYNIPTAVTGLKTGEASNLPIGTTAGLNDWKKPGYGGPCPPIGSHRYFFKLYALDENLTGTQPLSKTELEKAMKGHIVAETKMIGTYEKKK